VLALVAALSILPGVGRATLWEPDEPRFAEATRQMFERHDFATPYFNGTPRFEKPILLYWLQATASLVTGVNEVSARLPAAFAGIGSVLLLYLIASRVTSRRAALVSGLALATMFRFVALSRQGLTDVPVLFFIVAALYAVVRATEPADTSGAGRAVRSGRLQPAYVGWAAVGLGVLTKGPVGLLPVIVWACYAAVRRDMAFVTNVRPLLGPLLAILIAAPWYALMIVLHGRAFVDFALGHEIVTRVISEDTFAPTRGFFYYFKVWPGDAAPWSLMFVAAAAWSAVRWGRLDERSRQGLVLAFTWFLSVFLVFSLLRSKVPHYVLPAYPAAALAIGIFVDCVAQRAPDAAWWRIPMAIIAAVVLGAAGGVAWSIDVLMPDAGPGMRWLLAIVLAGGGAAIAVSVWRSRIGAAVSALAITLAATFASIGFVIIPGAVEAFKPMPRLARAATAVTPPGARIGLLGRYGASSLIYYSRHNIEWLGNDKDAVKFARRPGAVFVMPADDFQLLQPRLPSSAHIVDTAEEFNIRIERLLERQRTPGRKWVLVVAE
jgi:4-amino-4-deoxy-L-arabinose transferase-like glycosyltransferase